MVKRYLPQAGKVEQVSSRQVSCLFQAIGDKKVKVREAKAGGMRTDERRMERIKYVGFYFWGGL
jgi:hypothetical protein